MMGLTPRQQEAFKFIAARIGETGSAPSMLEIASALGMVAPSGAKRLVDALIERGYLRRIPFKARAIEVVASAEPIEAELGGDLMRRVDRCASEDGISRNAFIREAIRAYLGEAA